MAESTTYPTVDVERVSERLRAAASVLRTAVHPSAGEFTGALLFSADVAAHLADWLEAEATLLRSVKPFTVLLDYAVSQASGQQAHLYVGQDDAGQVQMACESSNQALTLAESILARADELAGRSR